MSVFKIRSIASALLWALVFRQPHAGRKAGLLSERDQWCIQVGTVPLSTYVGSAIISLLFPLTAESWGLVLLREEVAGDSIDWFLLVSWFNLCLANAFPELHNWKTLVSIWFFSVSDKWSVIQMCSYTFNTCKSYLQETNYRQSWLTWLKILAPGFFYVGSYARELKLLSYEEDGEVNLGLKFMLRFSVEFIWQRLYNLLFAKYGVYVWV